MKALICTIGICALLFGSVPTSGELTQKPEKNKIVLDAGHGGEDGGCISVNGTPEKIINLDIALTERDLLTVMGWEVLLTRDSDTAIYDQGITGLGEQKKSDMKNRLDMFCNKNADIAVSIHQNQFTDSRYSGAQMFYSRRNKNGELLANSLQKQFAALLQPENTREIKPVDDELYLLDKTDTPAVMAECGFLSNPDEAALLETSEYRRKTAFTIMTGIADYFSQNVRPQSITQESADPSHELLSEPNQ